MTNSKKWKAERDLEIFKSVKTCVFNLKKYRTICGETEHTRLNNQGSTKSEVGEMEAVRGGGEIGTGDANGKR